MPGRGQAAGRFVPRGRTRRTTSESRTGSGLWACPEPPGAEHGRAAPVVVHTPTIPEGGRAISVQGRAVGVARGAQDVILLVRRHGVELELEDLDGSPPVEWRGGDSAAWGLSESASS